MNTQFQVLPLTEKPSWMGEVDFNQFVRLNIAYVKDDGDDDDDDDDDDAPEEEDDELIYATRDKASKALSLLLTRNGIPAYAMDLGYELPNRLLTTQLSIDPIIPFFDDEDVNHIEGMLFRMAFAITDLSLIPESGTDEVEPEN